MILCPSGTTLRNLNLVRIVSYLILVPLAFSPLSGMSNTLPSIAIIRSPPRKAPGVFTVANGRTTKWNNRHITPAPILCLASVIDDLHGTCQYDPTFSQDSLTSSTKFFSTPLIEVFDHKLIPMIKQTTKCDGKARFRSSVDFVAWSACSIAEAGMAVSRALRIVPGSIVGTNKDSSFSCIFNLNPANGNNHFTYFQPLTEPYWELRLWMPKP